MRADREPVCTTCDHPLWVVKRGVPHLCEWGTDDEWYQEHGDKYGSLCDDCNCGSCGSRKAFVGQDCCGVCSVDEASEDEDEEEEEEEDVDEDEDKKDDEDEEP
jgi:hypothetical protein